MNSEIGPRVSGCFRPGPVVEAELTLYFYCFYFCFMLYNKC